MYWKLLQSGYWKLQWLETDISRLAFQNQLAKNCNDFQPSPKIRHSFKTRSLSNCQAFKTFRHKLLIPKHQTNEGLNFVHTKLSDFIKSKVTLSFALIYNADFKDRIIHTVKLSAGSLLQIMFCMKKLEIFLGLIEKNIF